MQDAARDQGHHLRSGGVFDRAMSEQARPCPCLLERHHQADGQIPHTSNCRGLNSKANRQTRSNSCEVLAIIRNGQGRTRNSSPAMEGEIILDHTPFYAEYSGGQVGDRGWF